MDQELLEGDPMTMTMQRPRFDWTWNVGTVLTLVGMLVTALVFGGVQIVIWKDYQAQVDRQISRVAEIVSKVNDAEERDRKDIDANQKAAMDRVTLYAPQLQAQERSQEVQDTRITGLAESIRSLRDIVAELTKLVSQTHEDLAVLKAQLQHQNGQHGG